MGEHGAGKGLVLPGDGHCLGAVRVGDDVHGVMLPGAAAALPDPPDPLPDRVESLAGAGPRQPLVELPQLALEALGEASGDPFLLFGALLGITVQPHLASVLIHHLVQVNLVVRPGLDGGGPLGVEAAGALAADHQITVAVVAQPGHVVLGGNPRIHHHQGVGGRVQGLEHRLQRLVFVDPAGKHFGAAHETRTVQHQPQGQQRTVTALLFRVPALCLGLVCW